MILDSLIAQGVIQPGANIPKWLPLNTQYLVQMGSVAYGVSGNDSDIDVYGFCVPPKHVIFPHLKGHINGFGADPEKFEQWQQHHIMDASRQREYDFSIYSIAKFFNLVAQNNPNMVDALFVPARCVLHTSQIGELVRERRKDFLSKASYHKFRGYAYQQMAKIEHKTNSSNPKRAKLIEEHGFDTKFAYHVVRLALEAEQIMETGDLDLERDRELLKAIRRGEWSLDQLKDWFSAKERVLEDLYSSTKLPHSPDWDGLRNLLHTCLEIHYGSLGEAVKREMPVDKLVGELEQLIQRYK